MLFAPEFHHQRFTQVTERVENQGNLQADVREGQVVLAMQNREKVNWLAFAVVGAALTINPTAITSLWTIIGAIILLGNALVFGYFADTQQINLNIKASTDEIEKLKEHYEPYADAYDRYIRNISEETEAVLVNSYKSYLDNRNAHKPKNAEKTRWAIGKYYFLLFFCGFIIFCFGITTNAVEDSQQKILNSKNSTIRYDQK